jgi:hypothetical protein
MPKERNLSNLIESKVAGRQFYKCANKPNSNLFKLKNYLCPMWCKTDENRGIFDDSGFVIDHIEDHSLTGNDEISNLQALCIYCHTVKAETLLCIHSSNKKIKKERKFNKYKLEEKCDDNNDKDSDDESYIVSDNELYQKMREIEKEFEKMMKLKHMKKIFR